MRTVFDQITDLKDHLESTFWRIEHGDISARQMKIDAIEKLDIISADIEAHIISSALKDAEDILTTNPGDESHD